MKEKSIDNKVTRTCFSNIQSNSHTATTSEKRALKTMPFSFQWRSLCGQLPSPLATESIKLLPSFRYDSFLSSCLPVQGDHSACSKPPVDIKSKVPFWPVQARPDHVDLMSMGGLNQPDVSPCTYDVCKCFLIF